MRNLIQVTVVIIFLIVTCGTEHAFAYTGCCIFKSTQSGPSVDPANINSCLYICAHPSEAVCKEYFVCVQPVEKCFASTDTECDYYYCSELSGGSCSGSAEASVSTDNYWPATGPITLKCWPGGTKKVCICQPGGGCSNTNWTEVDRMIDDTNAWNNGSAIEHPGMTQRFYCDEDFGCREI